MSTRQRMSALVLPKQNGAGSANGKVKDEPTARIDRYLDESKAVVLHHRHVPADGSEISHLIVGPCGVTVVDSSTYNSSSSRLERDVLGGSAKRRSALVKRVLAQVGTVRELLAGTPYAAVPVEAAMARRKVVGARVLQGINTPRVIVCGARTIVGEASRRGSVTPRRVKALAAYLDEVLD
jgi:Nuclease-related domain